MKTYVALLRAVNLGARNKVSMSALRKLMADLGCEDVETYVQSGNVVFKSPASPTELSDAIAKRIEKELGVGVAVLVLTGAQMANVVADNPFVEASAEPTRLYVTFLAGKPAAALVRELAKQTFEPDELRVVGQLVYLRCPDGYGRSKLSNAFFEKQLDVVGTTRNWRTVTKLAELAGA